MKQFNKEQLDALKQYEDNFNRAVNLNYYRNMTGKALDAIAAVYKAAKLVETLDQVFGEVPDEEPQVQSQPEPKPVKKATAKKPTRKATKK